MVITQILANERTLIFIGYDMLVVSIISLYDHIVSYIILSNSAGISTRYRELFPETIPFIVCA